MRRNRDPLNIGQSKTAEYRAWQQMIYRCYVTHNRRYPQYGARGIRVCSRWLGDGGFANFLADMGRKPSPDLSLGRKDNNGHYEPGNCRWETDAEQVSNKSNNHKITHNGKTQTVNQWARETGIGRATITMRLRRGWDAARALSTDPSAYHSRSNSQVSTRR